MRDDFGFDAAQLQDAWNTKETESRMYFFLLVVVDADSVHFIFVRVWGRAWWRWRWRGCDFNAGHVSITILLDSFRTDFCLTGAISVAGEFSTVAVEDMIDASSRQDGCPVADSIFSLS